MLLRQNIVLQFTSSAKIACAPMPAKLLHLTYLNPMPNSLLVDLTGQELSDHEIPSISYLIGTGVVATPSSIAELVLYQVVERFFDRGEIKDVDAENVSEIIRAGAECDVDEMTIRIDKDQVIGADLKRTLQSEGDGQSTKFSANLGNSGEMVYEIDVKYKD